MEGLQESILSRGRLPFLNNRRWRSRLRNQINNTSPTAWREGPGAPSVIPGPTSAVNHPKATEKGNSHKGSTSEGERDQCVQNPPTTGPRWIYLQSMGAKPRVWDTVNAGCKEEGGKADGQLTHKAAGQPHSITELSPLHGYRVQIIPWGVYGRDHRGSENNK